MQYVERGGVHDHVARRRRRSHPATSAWLRCVEGSGADEYRAGTAEELGNVTTVDDRAGGPDLVEWPFDSFADVEYVWASSSGSVRSASVRHR